MVAYNIDTAAVLTVLRDTEMEVASLGSLSSDLQGGVDAVGASLGPGPVARAFTRYAAETLFSDLRSGMISSGRALASARTAVAEYAAADEEMRARAEAAAAAVPAVLPESPATVVPPAGTAPGLIPAVPLPLPLPMPLPPPEKEPEPERGAVEPLPGPPPWRPIWPRSPLPVLPNPLPPRPSPDPAFGPWWWVCLPQWWWWMRPPGSQRWPGWRDWYGFRWPWAFLPLPGCPGPPLLPGRGIMPPPGCYYPIVPLENPLLRVGPPVARMLADHATVPEGDPGPESGGTIPDGKSLPARLSATGSRTWGLT